MPNVTEKCYVSPLEPPIKFGNYPKKYSEIDSVIGEWRVSNPQYKSGKLKDKIWIS